MKRLMVTALLCALSIIGAEVSGNWSGTADAKRDDGSTNTESVYFTFKQEGNTVTGTASGPNEDHSIKNGKVEGNTVTFELEPEGRGIFKVKMTVDGDKMTGDVSRDRDVKIATLSLKREK